MTNENKNNAGDTDVLVAGAGPAGSTAAYVLAKAGYRVMLVDKANFPREKLCGGCLTAKTVRLLEGVFGESPVSLFKKGIIDLKANRFAIHYKHAVLVDKATPPAYTFYFVDRAAYDRFFLEKARQAGAIVLEGDKVLAIDTAGNVVHTAGGHSLRARYIIAADGVNSTIRTALFRQGKIAGSKWRYNLGSAVEVRIDRAAAGALQDLAHPLLTFGYLHYGYGWLFPNRERLVIGIGGLRRKNKKANLVLILKQLMADFGIDPGKAASSAGTPAKLQVRGFFLPFGNFLVEPAWGNILLAGDAAGLVDPMLGEGIYQAHKSGQLAAQAISENMEEPIPGDGLKEYAARNYIRLLRESLLPEFMNARRMRHIVYMSFNHWSGFGIVKWLESQFGRLLELIHGDRTYRFPHHRKYL